MEQKLTTQGLQSMELLLATRNRHKLAELEHFLGKFGIEVKSLYDFPEIGEIPETGETLAENAMIKARAGFSATGLATIADDTGLEVDALDGAPGVYSARYAGPEADFEANIAKLLDAMAEVSDEDRKASFRTAAVFLDEGHEIVAHGEVGGEITRQRFGSDGFGYDSVFYYPEKQKTFAQMSLEEKNLLSHRKRAFQKLLARLTREHDAFSTEQPID